MSIGATPHPIVQPAGEPAPEPTAPPRFVRHYLAALLAQASALISAEFHEVVRRHGLSVAEWRVLASLSDGEAVSTGRLAQLVLGKQPTVTRQIDRMAQRGHIERLAHGSDRRVTLVRITPQGRQVVERLVELAREHERRVLAPFGLERAETLKDTLRQIIDLRQEADPTA